MELGEVIIAVCAQMGIVGMLFRWQHVQIRDNKLEVAKVSLKVYSKTEANEAIDLRLKPIQVGIAHVQDELKEVKAMIGQLLNAKNNKD
jgi:chaperonin cofactor prefoldin